MAAILYFQYLHVYVPAISWEVWDSLAPCTDDVWSRHVMVLAQSSPAWEARDSQVSGTFNHTARVLSGFQTFLSYRLHSRRLHTHVWQLILVTARKVIKKVIFHSLFTLKAPFAATLVIYLLKLRPSYVCKTPFELWLVFCNVKLS